MLKDILVHLDGSREDDIRLAYADTLATAHQSHLTGLYCNIVPELIIAGDIGMVAAEAAATARMEAEKHGNTVEKTLEKHMANLASLNDLRRIDVTEGRAGQKLAAEARTADLFVATRPYDHHTGTPQMLEQVLFDSGRGTLFVPPAIAPHAGYETVIVAWRNTREAARAVSEAMPILAAAGNVVVAIASEGAPEAADSEPGADIARHLDRHGVNVELRHLSGWSDPARAILNEQEKQSAGLIVMGGYGHSRFREWVLGGVTRDILGSAEIPVLLAH